MWCLHWRRVLTCLLLTVFDTIFEVHQASHPPHTAHLYLARSRSLALSLIPQKTKNFPPRKKYIKYLSELLPFPPALQCLRPVFLLEILLSLEANAPISTLMGYAGGILGASLGVAFVHPHYLQVGGG